MTVVIKYRAIVRLPSIDNFDISFKSDIPFINDANIKGIAINFRELINIVPNGFT